MKPIDEYAKALAGSNSIASSSSPDFPESREIVIGRRKASEEWVRHRIVNDLSDLDLDDWDEIINTMNENGFEKGYRYSHYFNLNNFHRLVKTRGPNTVNAAVEQLLRTDIDVVERIKAFQDRLGTKGPGLFSCVLSVMEPGTYFPWVGAVNDRVNQFGLCAPPTEIGRPEDYPSYCEAMREVMERHKLHPQEMDYLFTTFITLK